MRVCFLHARQDPRYPRLMLESVRRHMDCEIVMLTDEEEPDIDGCTMQRIPWDGTNVMEYRIRHLASLPEGEWLSLDTDMLVQHDLSKVFAFPFDVAVTQRDGPIWDTNGNDIVKYMPFNAGVVWWRDPEFWPTCHRWIMEQPEPVKRWYGDQLALTAITPRFDTLKLHCDNWNYPPHRADEDVSRRFIIHFKGARKPWMLQQRLLPG